MVNWKLEIGSRKWEMRNEKWEIESWKLEMRNGVGSGKWQLAIRKCKEGQGYPGLRGPLALPHTDSPEGCCQLNRPPIGAGRFSRTGLL